MQKRYELAKNAGLNWQALMIEDMQTEIKLYIQRNILGGKSFKAIQKELVERIQRMTEDLESGYLKEISTKSLYNLAVRTYILLNHAFKGANLGQITALVAVAANKASYEQIKAVEQIKALDVSKAYNRGVPLETYAKDYMRLVKQEIDYLAQMDAKENFLDRVTLRNIAEREVRREKQEKDLQKLIDGGIDLVWIQPHANASERCQKWQGKLYSIQGRYGEIDGIDFQPLANAMDVYETTRSGKVYKNGCISGFNCRHKLVPYNKKNKPIEIPAEIVNKERAIDQKLRYFERGIRGWRENALLYKSIDKKQAIYAREKAKEWNEKYIEFAKANKVPHYPSRTEILN